MSPPFAGRTAGALFLAAFVFYGGGTAIGDQPLGIALMLLNSVAVAAVGVLFHRPLNAFAARTATAYLWARLAEAVLLAIGVWFLLADRPEVDAALYTAAMIALAAGSIPMCLAIGRDRWVPRWTALWGAIGYALMATGAVLDHAVEGLGTYLAVPGGLFEIALGVVLLAKGFKR